MNPGNPFGCWTGTRVPRSVRHLCRHDKDGMEVVRRATREEGQFSLGNVTDIGLEETCPYARGKLAMLCETGGNPVRHQALKEQWEGSRDATLADCFQVY